VDKAGEYHLSGQPYFATPGPTKALAVLVNILALKMLEANYSRLYCITVNREEKRFL